MLIRVDGADVIGHLGVPLHHITLGLWGYVFAIGHIGDFIPEFPAHDVGGITPSGHDITDQILFDANRACIGEEVVFGLQSQNGMIGVVYPIARHGRILF